MVSFLVREVLRGGCGESWVGGVMEFDGSLLSEPRLNKRSYSLYSSCRACTLLVGITSTIDNEVWSKLGSDATKKPCTPESRR